MIVRITWDDGSEATFHLQDAAVQLTNGIRDVTPKEPGPKPWREIERDGRVTILITGKRA